MCNMKLTTLCYIERENAYLMLHRVSKEQDVNKDKWIGVGGHFEAGESPEECVLREVKEETGLTLLSWQFRGVITFSSEGWEDEYICLFTADKFSGELTACDEGVLEWVDQESVLKLNLWEGDKIFFRLLNEKRPFFSLKLSYRENRLVYAALDGRELELFDVRDSEGNVTGVARERELVHLNGDPHGTSHIWVVRANASGGWDVLLQKRSRDKDSYPGCYDVSSAGHLQAGDDFLPAALGLRTWNLLVFTRHTGKRFLEEGSLKIMRSALFTFIGSRLRPLRSGFRRKSWNPSCGWILQTAAARWGRGGWTTACIPMN